MPVGLGSRTANSSRVAQGSENSTFTLPNNEDAIIIGVGMDDDNGDRLRPVDDGDLESTLQFRTGADAFTDVLAASGAVRLTSATNLVEANTLTSGERLSTGTGGGSYIDGREMEVENAWTVDEVRDDYTEWQFGLDFSNAADSTTYDFRMSWEMKEGEFFISYISIITVVAAGGEPAFLPEVTIY